MGAPESDGEEAWSEIDEQELNDRIDQIKQQAKAQAIKDTAALFRSKGIRHDSEGRLGASINDPDIKKVDKNGVTMFYNPDTGRPFTGDNPRAQAKQWVDDYNAELKESFDKIASQREKQISDSTLPVVRTLQFAKTYESLDPVRQGMLDELISDYEVTDANGDVIGYSCDLNSALAAVNRQIDRIQSYGRMSQPSAQQQTEDPKPAASGPALDMKASSGGSQESKPEFNSVADALMYLQKKELEKAGKR